MAGPSSSNAWSTRWAPKSRTVPPPDLPGPRSGAYRSKRDSIRATTPSSAAGHELADGEEVGIPPAVLIRAQQQPTLIRKRDRLPGGLGIEREWLVADDRKAEVECLVGHGAVGVGRRGDRDRLDAGIRPSRPVM